MALEITPMYSALHRPRLLAGCERTPFLALVMGAIALPYFCENFMLLPFTGLVAMGLLALLRRQNQGGNGEPGDPQWTEVYMRSLRYQDFYPAQPCAHAKFEPFWPAQF